MRRPTAALGALAAACCGLWQSGTARADSSAPWAGEVDSAITDPGASAEHVTYSYAHVLHVVPVYQELQVAETTEICDRPDPAAQARPAPAGHTTLGDLIGGVIGLGNAHGRERSAASGTATALGAPEDALGQRGTGDTPEGDGCRQVETLVAERQLVAYDVEYRYRDEVFVSRLRHDPGDRLRLRVAVAPAEGAMAAEDAVLADGGY